MVLEVTIMSGAGNIFSVVDNRKYSLPIDFYRKFANNICTKSYSKGKTEGLLVVDKSEQQDLDFALRYFNPDGSFGMMCGNGGRCAVLFATKKGLVQKEKSPIEFDVWGEVYTAQFLDDRIKIKFQPPKIIQKDKVVELNNIKLVGDFINVNSPHYVIEFQNSPYADSFDFFGFPINEIAPQIRFHPTFEPEGVNVNFYQNVGDKVNLRTYERGVESETGACGTGAISTAISLFLRNNISQRFTIVPPSKEEIEVDINTDSFGNIIEIFLIGNASEIEVTKLKIND